MIMTGRDNADDSNDESRFDGGHGVRNDGDDDDYDYLGNLDVVFETCKQV